MGRAADRLGRVGKNLRALPEEGVVASTKIMKASVDASLRRSFGSDRRLSGVRNGRPQTINVTKRSAGQLVTGRVMFGPRDQRAPGFWRQEGTRSGKRGAKVGRYGSARANRGQHPGTPATHWWTEGVSAGEADVRKEFERLFSKAVSG